MIDLKNLELLKILPSSITTDEQTESMAESIDPELMSVSRDTREALIVSRIDELPDEVLNLLAWQWHVDFWEPEELSIEYKRALIKSSILWHRKKGTPWAVKRILRDLDVEPVIHEWFNFGGKPHTFGIEAYYMGDLRKIRNFLGAETDRLLKLAVEVTKPVRSHLAYLVVVPPELKNHGCRWDICPWGHGLLPGFMLEVSGVENPSEHGLIVATTLTDTRRIEYRRWGIYDYSRYGDVIPWTGQKLYQFISTTHEAAAGEPVRTDDFRRYPRACAVYNYASYGELSAMEARYWHNPETEQFDKSIYSAVRDSAGYRPVEEYIFKVLTEEMLTVLNTDCRVEFGGKICATQSVNARRQAPAWGDYRLGEIIPFTGHELGVFFASEHLADSSAMKEYNTWRHRPGWDAHSWSHSSHIPRIFTGFSLYPDDCAIFGYAKYGNIITEKRLPHEIDAGQYGFVLYGDSRRDVLQDNTEARETDIYARMAYDGGFPERPSVFTHTKTSSLAEGFDTALFEQDIYPAITSAHSIEYAGGDAKNSLKSYPDDCAVFGAVKYGDMTAMEIKRHDNNKAGRFGSAIFGGSLKAEPQLKDVPAQRFYDGGLSD